MSRVNYNPHNPHNPHNLPEGSVIPHPSHRSEISLSIYGYDNCGPELAATILPDPGDPFGSLELLPQPCSPGSGSDIETCHTSFTNLSNTGDNTTQDSRWASYRIYPPHPFRDQHSVLRANHISPFQSNPPSNYPYQVQSASPAQATRCDINQAISHPGVHPNHLQYPARQVRQLASGFQSGGYYPNPNTGNLAPSPLPSRRRPVRRSKRRGKLANHAGLGLHARHTCGIGFKRQPDLDRHLKTARKHSVPGGPACPEIGCKYTARFTRVDNFRAHYKGQHGKSDGESDGVIQEWKAGGRP